MPLLVSFDDDELTGERRGSPRKRALIGAQIIYRNGYCTMGCQILDVSSTGALLRPSDITLCPKRFVLKPRFDAPRNCELVWQRGEKLGVQYV
jgi:hypothetical protein